jgi:hypothetical protein
VAAKPASTWRRRQRRRVKAVAIAVGAEGGHRLWLLPSRQQRFY